MDLGEIRSGMFSQADWSPKQSQDAIDRANQFINRAYFQLVQEAPFLFFESRVGFTTIADSDPDTAAIRDATGNPAHAADTISTVTLDSWVLKRDLPTTTAGITAWDVSGRWRGRDILITDPDGVRHRRKIRDVWTTANVQHISLYQPWANSSDTLLDWRIYTEDYYLPDDVVEVNSLRLFEKSQNWPLDILGQMEAEKLSLADVPDIVATGIPRVAFRRPHWQIESPTTAPVTTVQGAWQGPEPAGEFEYCFTYCWGYRDSDFRDFGPEGPYGASQAGPSRLEPLWDSSPSPVSSAIALNDDSNGRIVLGLPDIDYMQGFGRTADPRYRHSGWRKRIYRRRKTVNTANYNTLPVQLNGAIDQETPDAFFLFADIAGWQTALSDDGSTLPDYHRRLREVNGYQALRMYPRPNKRYQVDIRCIRRPTPLKDDSDAPLLHPDAMNLILYQAIASLYEAQGNLDFAERSLGRYQELLFTLTKRYGDLRYPGQVIVKRPARAHKSGNTSRSWRRWYNLPTS